MSLAHGECGQPLGGSRQRLVLLAETEADVTLPVGSIAEEAASGHRGNADFGHEMTHECYVVLEAEMPDVRHDVVRALRCKADESGRVQNLEQAPATRSIA